MIDLYLGELDYTDYVYESTLFDLENVRFIGFFTAQQIALEAAIILDYLEDIGEVVTEAGKVKSAVNKAGWAPVKVVGTATIAANRAGAGAVNSAKGGLEKTKNFFIKIIDFIKGLGARFKDNMQSLFQSGGKWVEQRADNFKDINYAKLSTEVIEYWKGPKLNAIDFVSQDVRKGITNKTADHTKIEDYHKAYMDKYHDTNDDLKEGLLNYFRVSTAKGSNRVKVEGNGLKYVVLTHAIPYIQNYEKLVTEVQRQISKVERDLGSLQRGINDKDVAVESFLYGTAFEYTDMAHYPGFLDVVTEAKKKNRNRNQQQPPSSSTEDEQGDSAQQSQQSDAAAEAKKRKEEAEEATKKKKEEAELAEKKKQEEKEEADRKAAEAEEVKDSSASTSTKVTVKKEDKSPESRKEDEAHQKFDKEVEEFDEAKLKQYFYYASTQQLVLTSYMTVIEERYVAYMNILKAVWNAGNTVGGRNKEKTEEKK